MMSPAERLAVACRALAALADQYEDGEAWWLLAGPRFAEISHLIALMPPSDPAVRARMSAAMNEHMRLLLKGEPLP